MSGKRRAPGPKRQLSLQQSTRRPGLRKQASEDSSRTRLHDRNFAWDPHNDSALRVLANSISGPGSPVPQESKPPAASKRREISYSAVRPRPVKIAWTDRRQQSQDAENSAVVEVVAQRCKGQPRPVTAKPPSRSSLLVVQPNTILYSKDQLAERLRLAWKEREESRPNLDIFLTHGSFRNVVADEDCPSTSRGNRPATRNSEKEEILSFSISQSQPDNYSSISEKFSQLSTRTVNELFDFQIAVPQNKVTNVSRKDDNCSEMGKESKIFSSSNEGDCKTESPKQSYRVKSSTAITISLTRSEQRSIESDGETTCNTHKANNEPNCVKYSSTETRDPDHLAVDDIRNECTECSSTELSKCDSTECDSDLKEEKTSSEKPPEKAEPLTASARRVNFRNSGKAAVITTSFSISPTPPASPKPQATNKTMSSRKTNPFLPRMMSAPAQGRLLGVKSPSQQKDNTTKSIKDQNVAKSTETLTDSTLLEVDNTDEGSRRDRLIKSAPPKRKLKGGRRKGLRGFEEEDEDSSEEENNREEKPRPRRNAVRSSFPKGAEIVTMVSLLSPNESDVEEEESTEPVIQLPSEPAAWTSDNKVEASQTPSPKIGNENAPSQATISPTNIVCLRKAVSFQQSPAALNRSYTASYPSRRGTYLTILSNSDQQPAPPILATPTVAAKKKLVKAKSIGPLQSHEESNEDSAAVPEEEKQQGISVEVNPAQTTAADSSPQEKPPASTDKTGKSKETPDSPQDADLTNTQMEPAFKTAKEKECWMLFRRMADKGVAVSFDTVLRGMLTPTEYRLHKKALLSSC